MASPANWDPSTDKSTHPAPAKEASADPGLLPIGTDLGPYRVIAELGTGGMGMLYVGEHRTIGRRMAIKVLNPDLARRADIVRRFFDEARSVNTINHEHIVEIFDFIANPNGLNYLVMELLDGKDLQQSRVAEGPFALARTLSILSQVASALGAAHQKQIVHRDIKPENVFLTQRGGKADFVKLLDFGLAKLSESMKANADRTRAGTVLGTPEYMSPEQARGVTVDARSDIYALGLLLHWMLLDRLPWASRDLTELLELREQGAAVLPSATSGGERLPRALDAVVQRCLQPSPSKRFQSCAELESALADVMLVEAKASDFGERTVPVATLAVIGAGAKPLKPALKLAAAKTVPDPIARAKAPSSRPVPRTAPRQFAEPPTEERRRFQIPWMALALIGSLGLLAWMFHRARPLDRPALPDAPGSPYGASLMGPRPKKAPAEPTNPPAVPLSFPAERRR